MLCRSLLLLLALVANLAMADIIADRLQSIVVIETDMGDGSGVIISNDGMIVTNVHVLEKASTIKVTLADGKQFTTGIDFLAADEAKDIAIIQLPNTNTPYYSPINTSPVSVGNDILVMGNPSGYDRTVTRGIVSAYRKTDAHDVIQVDAGISPGSSGGGLFTQEGDLIGVTVAYSPDSENIGFVIPIKYVSEMLGENSAISIRDFMASASTQPFAINTGNIVRLEDIYEVLTSDFEFYEIQENNPRRILVLDLEFMRIGAMIEDFDNFFQVELIFNAAYELRTRDQVDRVLARVNDIPYAKLVRKGDGYVYMVEIPKRALSKAELIEYLRNLIALAIGVITDEEIFSFSNAEELVLLGGERPDVEMNNKYGNFIRFNNHLGIYLHPSWEVTSRDEQEDITTILATADGLMIKIMFEPYSVPNMIFIPRVLEENGKETTEDFSMTASGLRKKNGTRLFWASSTFRDKSVRYVGEHNVIANEWGILQLQVVGLRSRAEDIKKLGTDLVERLIVQKGS